MAAVYSSNSSGSGSGAYVSSRPVGKTLPQPPLYLSLVAFSPRLLFLFLGAQKETRKLRKIDDSHKYPLRKSGETGFLAEEAASSASASSSPSVPSDVVSVATGSRSSSNGHGGEGGGGSGGGSASSKQKGYGVHLAALGKLGAGSAGSRLFPKPGKKILRAVGQAVQVSPSSCASFCFFATHPPCLFAVIVLSPTSSSSCPSSVSVR